MEHLSRQVLHLRLCHQDLDIHSATESLVDERDQDQRQVLQALVPLLLRLLESGRAKCVLYRCSCARVAAPRAKRVQELFSLVV